MVRLRIIFVLLLAAAIAGHCQSSAGKAAKDGGPPPAEDISGMYSFLTEGEFLQINLEAGGVTGYISRMGDQESDRGNFLDQFFETASVHGHDVAFVSRKIHGEWFDFKGRFDRGHARSRAEDGFYILRGMLTQFNDSADPKNPASHARQVEFKSLAQPQDVPEKKTKAK